MSNFNENSLMYESYINKQMLVEGKLSDYIDKIKEIISTKIASDETLQKEILSTANKLLKDPKFVESVKNETTGSILNTYQKQGEQEISSKENTEEVETPVQEALGDFASWSNIKAAVRRKANELGRGPGGAGAPKYNDNDQQRVWERYLVFKDDIKDDLAELQRDLNVSSKIDVTVKNKINNIIDTLGTKEYGNLRPSQSKFQDFRHKIGSFLGGVATMVVSGIAIKSLAGLLLPVLGIKMATAGIMGVISKLSLGAITSAGSSVARDLLAGQKPNYKKAGIIAAAGVVIQGGMMAYDTVTAAKANVVSSSTSIDAEEPGGSNYDKFEANTKANPDSSNIPDNNTPKDLETSDDGWEARPEDNAYGNMSQEENAAKVVQNAKSTANNLDVAQDKLEKITPESPAIAGLGVTEKEFKDFLQAIDDFNRNASSTLKDIVSMQDDLQRIGDTEYKDLLMFTNTTKEFTQLVKEKSFKKAFAYANEKLPLVSNMTDAYEGKLTSALGTTDPEGVQFYKFMFKNLKRLKDFLDKAPIISVKENFVQFKTFFKK